jgi:hypothetical protein
MGGAVSLEGGSVSEPCFGSRMGNSIYALPDASVVFRYRQLILIITYPVIH